MRYVVSARWWDRDPAMPEGPEGEMPADRFGEFGSTHELSDSEVVELIKRFGRASIEEVRGELHLCFENDYD